MKKLALILILFVGFSAFSQYTSFSVKKEVQGLEIIQLDSYESSTIVHFQFTYTGYEGGVIMAADDIYIVDKSNSKKYRLLNSINLPLDPQMHVFSELGQVHNFSLEFERIPEGVREIDIIENVETGWKIFGIEVDWSKGDSDFLDISSFTEETPVKEMGYYYLNGETVYYYDDNEISVAVYLTWNSSYGKHFQANILIGNKSGSSFNFRPEKITAIYQRNSEFEKAEVYTHDEYMKKVKKRQSWNSVAVAMSEGLAAGTAGYSSTTSTNSSYVYGPSGTYSVYGTTYSQNYNPSARYQASLNASRNIADFEENQYQIKRRIGNDYIRLHTIPNETEYFGYLNIKYKKVDHLKLVIRIHDKKYEFYW